MTALRGSTRDRLEFILRISSISSTKNWSLYFWLTSRYYVDVKERSRCAKALVEISTSWQRLASSRIQSIEVLHGKRGTKERIGRIANEALGCTAFTVKSYQESPRVLHPRIGSSSRGRSHIYFVHHLDTRRRKRMKRREAVPRGRKVYASDWGVIRMGQFTEKGWKKENKATIRWKYRTRCKEEKRNYKVDRRKINCGRWKGKENNSKKESEEGKGKENIVGELYEWLKRDTAKGSWKKTVQESTR